VKGRGVSPGSESFEKAESDDRLAGMIVGRSAAMCRVAEMVRQVARYPSTTILLQGESGTGKEVVARAIHDLSNRAAYPFVGLNCAAIPEALLESELFGVEAGAFTDARATREGHLLRADGGTLFLDEIGSMPLVLQAKLLRFLETRCFRRVGGTKEIHLDLRVISATNSDLQREVTRKTFRDDLFYRLKVITIDLPPLREHPDDIELLVDHFLQIHNAEREHPVYVSREAIEVLLRYPWPGNVRELRNVIEHGIVLCDNNEILPANLPERIRLAGTNASQRLLELRQLMHLPPEGIDLPAFLSGIEQTFIQEALERCEGNQVRAAALLHISRDQLRYRLSTKNQPASTPYE
jgi:two-component system, NtrC family, response regulator AtoC